MNFKYSALCVALSASLCATASAQQTRLDATKVVNEDNEISQQFDVVLDAETLQNQSITNIEDTTRYISGVQVNNNGTRFGDDGFNIRGLSGDAVAVTVDGVSQGETLNPATYAAYGMYGSSRGQVELEHVKSVTITKGPSSVTRGASALAGSVAYVTNDAADFLPELGDAFGGKVKAGFDSRSEEWLVSGAIANRTGAWETLLQYTHREGSETEAHSNGANINGAERGQADLMDLTSGSVLVKVAYNLDDDMQVGVIYEKTDRESEGTPLSREPVEGATGTYYDFATLDDNNRERYGVFFKQYNANNAFYDSVEATLNYQELFTSGVTAFSYTRGGPAILRVEDRNLTQESTSFNLDFTKSLDAGLTHELVYGVNYSKSSFLNVMYDIRYNSTTVDSGIQDDYPIRDPAFIPESDKTAFSLYLADSVALTDQLTASVGLRYDTTEYDPTINDTFADPLGQSVKASDFTQTVGEASLTYEFTEGHAVIVKVAQGYQAPTLQDLYLGTNSGGEVTDVVTGVAYDDLTEVANPELGAETSTNYELVYRGQFENGGINVAFFRTDYTDLIQDVTLSNPYGTDVTLSCGRFEACDTKVVSEDTYQMADNAGEVEVTGFEIDANYRFTRNISAYMTYSSIEGEYKTASSVNNVGDNLVSAAPDTATLGLGYRSDDGDWGAQLHAIHRASVSNRATVEDDAGNVIKEGQLSYDSANRGGIVYFPDSFTVFDLTAYYDFSENLSLTAAIYNLTDKEHYMWESLSQVNNSGGTGGFATSVGGMGYQRFSEPGRSFSAYLTYTF